MTSEISVTHTADTIGELFAGLKALLPTIPAGATLAARVVATINEKPVTAAPVVPPSAQSASPAQAAPAPSSPAPVTEDAPARKRGRPRKEEAAPTPPAPQQVALQLPPQADKPTGSVTKDDVRSALHTLVTKRDLELGAAVLSRFGARKLSDLKEDQYVKFIAHCHQTAESGEA